MSIIKATKINLPSSLQLSHYYSYGVPYTLYYVHVKLYLKSCSVCLQNHSLHNRLGVLGVTISDRFNLPYCMESQLTSSDADGWMCAHKCSLSIVIKKKSLVYASSDSPKECSTILSSGADLRWGLEGLGLPFPLPVGWDQAQLCTCIVHVRFSTPSRPD